MWNVVGGALVILPFMQILSLTFLLLGSLKLCTRVITAIVNARDLKR